MSTVPAAATATQAQTRTGDQLRQRYAGMLAERKAVREQCVATQCAELVSHIEALCSKHWEDGEHCYRQQNHDVADVDVWDAAARELSAKGFTHTGAGLVDSKGKRVITVSWK